MHRISQEQIISPYDNGQGEVVYEILGRTFPESTKTHSVALVVISSGKSSRPHLHPIAEESYYMLKGSARIRVGEELSALVPGQVVYIPPGKIHQIENTGDEPLEFLAICVPAWEPENSEFFD